MRLPRTLLLSAALLAVAAPARAQVGPAEQQALLSEHTMLSLERVAEYGAQVMGVPGPGPDFAPRERQWLRASAGVLKPATVQALLGVDQTLPAMQAFVGRATPQQRARFAQSMRSDTGGGSDLVVVAEKVAIASVAGARHEQELHRGAAMIARHNARMQEASGIMQRSLRAYSDECSGIIDPKYRSSDGYCQSNPNLPNVGGGVYGTR